MGLVEILYFIRVSLNMHAQLFVINLGLIINVVDPTSVTILFNSTRNPLF